MERPPLSIRFHLRPSHMEGINSSDIKEVDLSSLLSMSNTKCERPKIRKTSRSKERSDSETTTHRPVIRVLIRH